MKKIKEKEPGTVKNKNTSRARGGSEKTRKILRQEANFGCAICGEPYLTYHHFNPSWANKPHDNPEGMIALCNTCAKQADGGAYTNKQLVEHKRNPCLQGKDLASHFRWRRQKFLYFVGGNIVIDCNTLVKDNRTGEKVIWQEEQKETGLMTISLKIKNAQGGVILQMKQNQWEVCQKEVYDVDSSSQGKKLKVIGKEDTRFQIWFRSLSHKTLEKKIKKQFNAGKPSLSPRMLGGVSKNQQDLTSKAIETGQKKVLKAIMRDVREHFDEQVPICTLTGQFYVANSLLSFKENHIVTERNCKYYSNYFGNSPVAFGFGNGTTLGGK